MKLNIIDENNIREITLMENISETTGFIIPYSEKKHIEEINNPLNKYLGIYENGELLGFIILGIEDKGKIIEFRRIVIKNKGNGYGQKAIEELENYCKDVWNTEKIWLDVFEDNERGIHIYQKYGYKNVGVTKYQSRNLLIMEKNL